MNKGKEEMAFQNEIDGLNEMKRSLDVLADHHWKLWEYWKYIKHMAIPQRWDWKLVHYLEHRQKLFLDKARTYIGYSEEDQLWKK